MKRYGLFLLILLIAGCSSNSNKPLFLESQAVPFEIVTYEEKIAPVYESLVPYIAYAKTQGQFEELKARFQIEDFTMNMDESFAVFIVTYSDGCGIAVDGVYNNDGRLSTQLIEATGQNCDKEGVPHTFVLKVDRADYEKVQLYNGDIIKSSMDVE